ncbi:hypothetical protein Tco_1160022 [Tanacetum coccineum]
MHQPRRSFAAIINKCLSGKTTALESLRLSRAQIIWGMYHNKTGYYVYLLWEDLVYQVENQNSKKNNDMYYPRFTKVVVDYFMAKDQGIPRRNKIFWHYSRDDFMFTTKKVDSESSPKMKSTQASKGKRITTLAKGDKPAKKKQSTTKSKGLMVLSEVTFTEAQQMKIVIERSKIQTHSSYDSGSGDGADIQSKVPDDQGEDDEDNDEHDSENDNDDEDDDQENVSGETESDNDRDDFIHPNLSTYKADDQEEEKEEEKENDDDMSSNQMVSTPPDYEITKEEENQEDDDDVMGG